jgi:hypothetical protein
MKVKILTLMLFFSTSLVHATGYTGEGLITEMFVGAGNIVGVFHSGTKFNPKGCSIASSDDAYLFDYSSTADMSKVYAMLLSAYISKTPVKIGVNSSSCHANFPVIDRVAFGKGY